MLNIKCIAAVVNANGESDFYFAIIQCSQEQYDNGQHYSAMCDAAEKEGYEFYLAYDENEPAGKALLPLFHWETATVVVI
jgi:hypothetical protein